MSLLEEMASGKSKFEKSLERFLNESRSVPNSDWCLAPLENSIFLSLWDDADEQLLKDCRVAMRVIAHEILDSLEAEMDQAVAACVSPIERRLFLALLVVGRHLDALSTSVEVIGHYTKVDLNRYGYDEPHVSVIPQHDIDDHRVDFLIEYAQEYWPRMSNRNPEPRCALASLIIECDGHEFHDRTKEQASNDRARDRKLKKLGYEVFRYTGSDIYGDPFKCAMDAWDMVVRSVQSLKRDFDKKYPVTMDDLLD